MTIGNMTIIPAGESDPGSSGLLNQGGYSNAVSVAGQQSRGDDQIINPVMAYLLRLESTESRKVMRSALNRVAGILGFDGCENIHWNDIRRNHVQLIMYELEQRDLAPATRSRYLSAIKGVVEEVWLGGGMPAESYQRIKSIRGPKGSRLQNAGRVIPKSEIAQLMEKSGDRASSLIGIRDRAILALLLTSGVRKSEISGIKTNRINIHEKSFTIIRKGNKEQKLFLQPVAIDYINQWVEARNVATEYLFTPVSRGGRPLDKRITAYGVTYILRRAASSQGVPEFAPHDTRRTFATKLFAAGVDPIKIRDLMGHASLETTQIYNIADVEALRNASTAINDLF